jgi:uncharacterized membrane protein (UPF0127 family)
LNPPVVRVGATTPVRDDRESSRAIYPFAWRAPPVRLEHRRDGGSETLAEDVEVVDTFLSKARGLMFRRSIPDDYAMVFRFEAAEERDLHMVFVPFDIDALWLVDGEVVAKKRLRAWLGRGAAEADTVVELPAGSADDVAVGDEVRLR